jgi:hypothetical protein
MIYFWTDVTVRVAGEVWRTCDCEDCGRRFHYLFQSTAVGTGHAPFMLFKGSAEASARKQAVRALERSLETEVCPVPCPWCGHYQADMAEALRRRQYRWMRTAAQILWWTSPLLVFGPALVLLLGLAESLKVQPNDIFGWIALAAAAACPLPGLVVYLWYRRRQRAFDPNDEATRDERVAHGKRLAVRDDGTAPAHPEPA